MYEYSGLATYDVYKEQLEKILSSTPKYLRKIIRGDNQLYGSLITTMMLADWRFQPSKGFKQSTFRIASLKFKLRNILSYRKVLTQEKLLMIANVINPAATVSKLDVIDIMELENNPKYSILLKYIEGFSGQELGQMFNISPNNVMLTIHKLAKELYQNV